MIERFFNVLVILFVIQLLLNQHLILENLHEDIIKVSSFEDLQVWRDSRKLVKSIYELTSKGTFSKDYGLKEQIQRASVSIMNNIAEGFERKNNKEYVKFLGYSKGSAGKVR